MIAVADAINDLAEESRSIEVPQKICERCAFRVKSILSRLVQPSPLAHHAWQ